MQPPDQPAPGEPTPVPPQVPPAPSSSSPNPGEPPPMVPPQSAAPGDSTKDDRTMAMIAHIGGVITNFIAPLIVWLIKQDQPGFGQDQAKEALNFQITVAIAYAVWGILTAIPLLGCLVAPAVIVIFLASLVFGIVAGVKANEGVRYRYPVTLRLVK